MLQNSLAYITILLFLFQLVEVNCQKVPFKPIPRIDHSATLVDNKLYILGGTSADNDPGKDFFYLDVSVPFNTLELSWQDLSNINILPSHGDAATVKGGADNNTLILYGGDSTDNVAMNLVYTFNPENNSWNPLVITGDNAISKFALSGVIDQNRKMYLWGGVEVVSGEFTNYMLILDTINFTMGRGNIVGAPTQRQDFGATLLSNQNIIYLGGFNNDKELTLSEVYMYDTINDKWSKMTTVGKIPSNRDGFSVTLGLDDKRIIIYGGTASANNVDLKPEDSLYVLDLTNFEWYIPKVSGAIPKSRMYHQANLIGKYIVISFGTDDPSEGDILLLDISNNEKYMWTNDFNPPIVPTPTSSPTSAPLTTSPAIPSSTQPPTVPTATTQTSQLNSLNNQIVMFGVIAGSLFSGALLSFGYFFLYKRKNRRKQNDILSIPGSDRENAHNQSQEILINNRNDVVTSYEPMAFPAPVINKNPGQEITIANDERLLTFQNIDNLKNELKQEIMQEMLQNNGQASNITRNNNLYYHN